MDKLTELKVIADLQLEEIRKTNRLLSLLIQALSEGDPDALPVVDMDGNPV